MFRCSSNTSWRTGSRHSIPWDLAGILKLVATQVDFHPPRMTTGGRGYRGDDGLGEWPSLMIERGPEYRFRVDRISRVNGESVVATGALVLGGDELSGL